MIIYVHTAQPSVYKHSTLCPPPGGVGCGLRNSYLAKARTIISCSTHWVSLARNTPLRRGLWGPRLTLSVCAAHICPPLHPTRGRSQDLFDHTTPLCI